MNISDWNEEIAAELAKEEGIEILTEKHWQVINYMRKVYSETGDSPSIRKLTKESGVDTKELYALFPKRPGKKKLQELQDCLSQKVAFKPISNEQLTINN